MRKSAGLCILLGSVVALLPVSAAQAKINPLPKPTGTTDAPATESAGSTIAPLARPNATAPATAHTQTKKPVKTSKPPKTAATTRHTGAVVSIGAGTVRAQTTTVTRRQAPPQPVQSSGGRAAPSPPPVTAVKPHTTSLMPTPLSFVGRDALPSYDSWPSWMLAMFTLAASIEAFLLTRLVRARRYATQQANEAAADLAAGHY
jgi:hypothetical protein